MNQEITNRWKYPFNSKEKATTFLKPAEKETGKKCSVYQVSVKAHVFKIFTSENEYNEYQRKKRSIRKHH